MVRIRGALEILQVTGDARGVRQVVVVVYVTIGALTRRYHVCTGQRKIREVMVEGRVQPIRSAVTLGAIGGEVRGHVVRVRRTLKILKVAAHAR